MDTELSNTVSSVGLYNDVPTELTSDAVIISIVDGLTILKEADKQYWAGGNLTYTITITNNALSDYKTPAITDVLDFTKITLVSGSVMIDDVATSDYTYDDQTGKLIVNLPDVAVSDSVVLTFQVEKI